MLFRSGDTPGVAQSNWLNNYLVEYSGRVSVAEVMERLASTQAEFTEDRTLYADGSLLSDADGLGVLSYQWQRSTDLVTWSNVSGASAQAYTLGDADVGKFVRTAISYTDGQGTAEVVYSASSLRIANVNDAPTGAVTITGTATQGQTLTASNNIADVDEIGRAHV